MKKNEIWTNVILGAVFANFVYHHSQSYADDPRISTLLAMLQAFSLVIFFLIRSYPSKTSSKPADWIFASLATWLPFFFMPVEGSGEIAIFVIIQLIGMLITITGIMSLNRSIAIIASIRTIKTSGLYKLVRHPMYLGYVLAFSSFVAQNISIANVAILITIITCDIRRILAEETILSEMPEYQLYKQRTRYRLIPFIW